MSNSQHGRRKPVSEDKRERDVFLLYGAAFRDIPHLDEVGPNPQTCSLPANHVPRLSKDSILTALAQLATFRLGAGRAMISLIDDQKQYILAEATPNMSIHPQEMDDSANPLWLGRVSIPRTWGMCEKVLNIDLHAFIVNEFPALVIRDLRESVEHSARSYVKETNVRFYAGAPLVSPTGAIVGSVCVLDDTPRTGGLSKEHERSLHDISRSIMDYLHTYTIKDQLRRGERFTRGLISFSEGGTTLQPFKDAKQHDYDPTKLHSTTSQVLESPFDERHDPLNVLPSSDASTMPRPVTVRSKSSQQRSIQKLQETILPTDARSMFSRAANVMLASSDLDGVIILDASVAANRTRRSSGSQDARSTGTGTEDAVDSYQSMSSSSEGDSLNRADGTQGSQKKYCQVLGSAISDTPEQDDYATRANYGSLAESDLTRLLHDFPSGRIITFGVDGLPLSSTDDSGTSSGSSKSITSESPRRKGARGRLGKVSGALQAMLPGARSIAFVPFWDYERSRWFAGCLCWSNKAHRLLSATVDLAYFKVFSHSVMRELSRLDALASNQSKTTLVASISHELRSPLHGILGTLEFIKDTPLDSFQISMLNSLNACGQTLLDTINHVMEYAAISEATRTISSRKLKSTHTIRLSSKPPKNRRPIAGAFDFGIATEEVVEAVFSGSSYVPISSAILDSDTTSSDAGSELAIKRKTCYVVLDVGHEEDWMYCFPVGSWKRIVMNIFGNAVKYTETGHIVVKLRVNDGRTSNNPITVTLNITDSGAGMSPQFLANKAFQPFSQENSFASGTGLGLSIVRQIIETNGGKIEVSSEPAIGTKVTVKLALTRSERDSKKSPPIESPQRKQFLSFLPRFEGRTICILESHREETTHNTSLSHTVDSLTRFTNALAQTLTTHLKMKVVRTTDWEGHDTDLVIAPELSFDYLAKIRRSRSNDGRAPVTIFIAMDGLEAATLRSDARVRNKESVVEIMTQPCGPFKLAYILNQCLDRFDLPEENLKHHSSGSEASQLGLSSSRGPGTPTIRSSHTRNTGSAILPSLNDTQAEEPDISARPLSHEPHPTQPSSHASSEGCVLIVDDNAINRSLLVAFMKKHHYQYEEAENGLEAFEAYRNGAENFRFILMDMSMPVMDGMTSTRAIRQHEDTNRLPRCRIVALTGLTSASARLEALSSGVDHFMTKPLSFRALAALLKKDDDKRRASFAMQVVEGRDQDE